MNLLKFELNFELRFELRFEFKMINVTKDNLKVSQKKIKLILKQLKQPNLEKNVLLLNISRIPIELCEKITNINKFIELSIELLDSVKKLCERKCDYYMNVAIPTTESQILYFSWLKYYNNHIITPKELLSIELLDSVKKLCERKCDYYMNLAIPTIESQILYFSWLKYYNNHIVTHIKK